jgi:hypothetical protein
MSRGPGKLQRQILDHLEDPLPVSDYSGGHRETSVCSADCILDDGVYDLRWVSRVIWREMVNSPATLLGRSGMDGCRSDAYSAAFSRAVKGLLKRRILYALPTVPLTVMYRWRNNSRIGDDVFRQWEGKTVRFVQYGSAHPKFQKKSA